jgi:hypothetical protein
MVVRLAGDAERLHPGDRLAPERREAVLLDPVRRARDRIVEVVREAHHPQACGMQLVARPRVAFERVYAIEREQPFQAVGPKIVAPQDQDHWSPSPASKLALLASMHAGRVIGSDRIGLDRD